MKSAITGLQPEGVWRRFAEIARIPRGSKNEAAISRFILETAKKLGLEAKADGVGNVAVKKPASPGYEGSRGVCLQGHLDMVCEKVAGSSHDFSKDPIELVREGNVITAKGTTLGADNGIAVATCLAIMSDSSLEHGPIEFLLTVDEETGLTGASSLQAGFVESPILLNLDSEEEGALYVGCSGGRDTTGAWTASMEPVPPGMILIEVKIQGLKGGHSGLEIDKGCGNAVKIMNRILLRLADAGGRIAAIDGGNKHNAIPREAETRVFVPSSRIGEVRDRLRQTVSDICSELATVEPTLSISVSEMPKTRRGKVWKKALQKRVLQTLTVLPHGVIKMSADIPGLVETSTNLAIVKTEKNRIRIVTSQRSSVASELGEIGEVMRTIFAMGGAEVHASDGYPGWKPNMDSEILRLAKETYLGLYGKNPEVKAIHAGLECGIIGEKYPGMDMVSFGPTLQAVHTPDERIYIDTVERFWQFLLALLRKVR